MASLIEELIFALEEEDKIYETLIPIAEKKTQAIVENNMESLQAVTNQEQELINRIVLIENKRDEAISNIAVVLNRSKESLNLKEIINILVKQPQEQHRLRLLHDKLKLTMNRLVEINMQNKSLIQESLEMIEFNLNFIRSTRMSAGSNHYTKRASQFDVDVFQTGMFDAKQ